MSDSTLGLKGNQHFVISYCSPIIEKSDFLSIETNFESFVYNFYLS